MHVEISTLGDYVAPMSDDFVEEPERRVRPEMAATIAVLVVNAIAFGFQNLIPRLYPQFPLDTYFALSLDGLRHGCVWQLLTYQFMHGSWLHIFFNSWAIYIFGRVVETTIGKWRMLALYFLSGIAGGLLQILGTLLAPGLIGGPEELVIGASAGASGLLAAFATLYPQQVMYMLLYFVIPLKMKARTMLWVWVATSVVGIFIPYTRLNLSQLNNVAHLAHLGGTAMGFLFAWSLVRRYRRPPPIIAPPDKSSLDINPARD